MLCNLPNDEQETRIQQRNSFTAGERSYDTARRKRETGIAFYTVYTVFEAQDNTPQQGCNPGL